MFDLKSQIKTVLRIKSDDFLIDFEIEKLISACVDDMILAGVDEKLANDDTNPLSTQAKKFYAKAYFGDSDESGKFQRAYEALRDRLAIGGASIG